MSNFARRRPVGAPSLLNDSRHPSRPVGLPQHRIRMGRPRGHGDEGSGGSISLGVPIDFEVPALVSIAGVLVVAAATKGCPCSKLRNTEKP